MHGPNERRRHDTHMLCESGFLIQLQKFAPLVTICLMLFMVMLHTFGVPG